MTALVGGLVAVVLGLIGLGWWHHKFFDLLEGGIPLLLLLGGALAVYLGFEETKDKFFKKGETPAYEPPKMSEAEVEQYKAEVERLKSEVEELKEKKPKK
jgi:hypothetical protein